ncbi:MAG: hypothetical protein ACETWM_17250 [Candidatus Lokiarchaeia archaeon]
MEANNCQARIAIKVWHYPELTDCMDQEAIRESLSEIFDVEWLVSPDKSEIARALPAGYPVVLTIAISLGTLIAIGLKKVVELISEDLYKLAKKIAKSLFKRDPTHPRKLRIQFRTKEGLDVMVTIEAFTVEGLEKGLSSDIKDLLPLILQTIEQRRMPQGTSLKCCQHSPPLVLSAGDSLPTDAKWLHIHIHCEADIGWRVVGMWTDSGFYEPW